jgi:hypothetical protein
MSWPPRYLDIHNYFNEDEFRSLGYVDIGLFTQAELVDEDRRVDLSRVGFPYIFRIEDTDRTSAFTLAVANMIFAQPGLLERWTSLRVGSEIIMGFTTALEVTKFRLMVDPLLAEYQFQIPDD